MTTGEGELLDGRYRLGRSLGRGGVADVYEAVDERLDRHVAIKIFRGDAADELQRHESEMRTLAKLEHPALVTVFDAGRDPDSNRPYLVLQLVEGMTLAEQLGLRQTIPADQVAVWGASLCDALAYVHGQGFIHRDVKPANVLISGDNRVYLADFGIARLVDAAHVTRTGEVLGTPAYFAPEQVESQGVGPACDIYSLGLVLLESLTGEKAFEGTSLEVAMARLTRDPDVPNSLPMPWPVVLPAMLARYPQQRPLPEAVAARLRGEPVSMSPPTEATAVLLSSTRSTRAMPGATQATQATTRMPVQSIPVTGGPSRHRAGIVIVLVLLAILVGGGTFALIEKSNSHSSNSTYTPGTPTLHPRKLEQAMQKLEEAVQ